MSLRLGLANLNQTPLDWPRNLTHLSKAIRWAKKYNIHLLATPELSLTGYGCEDFFFADWLYEKALQLLITDIVPQTQDLMLAVGLPLRHKNKRYIALCVASNRRIKGFYAKQTLASQDVYYEPRWFSAWPQGTTDIYYLKGESYPIGEKLFLCQHKQIGFEICEDAWQNSRPLARYAQQNADLVINTSASHFVLNKYEKRRDMVVNSARQYQLHYAYVNALGNEAGTLIYDGDQYVAQPQGLCHENTRFASQQVVCTQITFPQNKHKISEKKLRKINPYEECTQALSLALWDYYQKSKLSGGFVLSLSGGADSAMCAVLLSEMQRRHCPHLSMKNLLLALYQSTDNSSETTRNLAQQLSKDIGCAFNHWSVQDTFDAYKQKAEQLLRRRLKWETDAVALQNLQARARNPGLWLLANLKQALLVNTSNRSELSVGYATVDGDLSGSLAPIAGLDKNFVRNYLLYAHEHYGYGTVKSIAVQVPKAELMPASYQQQDEKDLMPYETLARMERLLLHERLSLSDMQARLPEQDIPHLPRFLSLFQKNQWKRERTPPSLSVDTYNLDTKSQGRYPILMGELS